MADRAERKRTGAGNPGRRRRSTAVTPDDEGLKLLRLDLHTLTEQIRILDDELKADPCLTTEAVTTVLSLVDALKLELERARLRMLELEGPNAA